MSAPEGARSVICAYCGARLEVHHFTSDADRAGLGQERNNRSGGSMAQESIGDRGRLTGDRSEKPVGWQVVASFKFVHDWHEAARVLSRIGITARMEDDPRDASFSALAVQVPDVEAARHLLSQPGQGALRAG